MNPLEQIIQNKKPTTQQALHVFEELDTVSIDFMKGRWRGEEIATDHPLDGLLEVTGWYGKLFVDENNVHPLLFYTKDKKSLFSVDPKHIPLGRGLISLKQAAQLAPMFLNMFKTKKASAHLEMMECIGKVTATMVYNQKPIKDFFKKIDENRLLGMMKSEAFPEPYFFMLVRDDESEYKILI